MKPTYQDIKAAARYRWQEIHTAIGIDPKFLRNKHQPCPACGGEDRFRYDDKDGNRRSSVEMRATAVGPDLSRWRVEAPGRTGEDAAVIASTGQPDPAATDGELAGADESALDLTVGADAAGRRPLPLSA